MRVEFHCETCDKVANFGQFVSLVNETYLTFDDNQFEMYLIIHKSCQEELSKVFDNLEIVDSTEDLLLVHVWNNDEVADETEI